MYNKIYQQMKENRLQLFLSLIIAPSLYRPLKGNDVINVYQDSDREKAFTKA